MSFLIWAFLNVFAFSFWLSAAQLNRDDHLFTFLLNIIFSGAVYLVLWFLFLHAGLLSGEAPFKHFFIIGGLVSVLVGICTYFGVRRISAFLDSPSNSLKVLGLTIRLYDAGAKIVLTFWLFSLLITLLFATSMTLGVNVVKEGFFHSWAANVVFYSVLGAVVGIYNFKRPNTDTFGKRLSLLYDTNDDALDAVLAREVSKLGVFAKREERYVEIIEYNSRYKAYKLRVFRKSTLVNVFFDVSVTDRAKFSLTPDVFGHPTQEVPELLGQVTAIRIGGSAQNILDQPLEMNGGTISLDHGFSVYNEPLDIEFEYWWWMSIFEDDYFRPSRFTKQFKTDVTNNMSGASNLAVPIVFRSDDRERTVLSFGKRQTVFSAENLDPHESVAVFGLDEPIDTRE